MTLAQNIRQLMEPHKAYDHEQNIITRRPLLEQLTQAVTASTRPGSPAGDGKALPIGAGALSLEQQIHHEARDLHYRFWGHDQGPILALIRRLEAPPTAAHVVLAEQFTTAWVESIHQLISPTKPPYRPAVPCPSCKTLYNSAGEGPGLRIYCWAADETQLLPRDWSAECIHCGAYWSPGEEMAWLQASLHAGKLPA